MTRIARAAGLFLFFVWELVLSSLRVARDVLLVSMISIGLSVLMRAREASGRFRPGIVAVPLDLESDAGITLLACLVTLTPGTLSLDVSEDKKTLYVHAMRVDDPEAFRREIKDGFERRVRGILP